MEKFLYSENASARSKRSGFLIVNQSTLNAICKYWNLFYISIRAYACRSRGPVAGIDWCWRISKGLPSFLISDNNSLCYRSKKSKAVAINSILDGIVISD